jgi:sporulation protein YtfJ
MDNPREHRDNQIEQILSTAMSKIKTITDTDTIVGRPVMTPDGATIIPVSRVSMGFIAGGGEYGDIKALKKDGDSQFAGGSGAAVTLTPIGFLVSNSKGVKIMPMSAGDGLEKIAEIASDILAAFKNRKSGEGGAR